MIELPPPGPARYRHAECLGLRPERRCRRCREGGLAVRVLRHESNPDRAVVVTASGREFSARPCELAEPRPAG